MSKYGIENVRGGPYVSCRLTNDQIEALKKQIDNDNTDNYHHIEHILEPSTKKRRRKRVNKSNKKSTIKVDGTEELKNDKPADIQVNKQADLSANKQVDKRSKQAKPARSLTLDDSCMDLLYHCLTIVYKDDARFDHVRKTKKTPKYKTI
jgi:hypothetical protein